MIAHKTMSAVEGSFVFSKPVVGNVVDAPKTAGAALLAVLWVAVAVVPAAFVAPVWLWLPDVDPGGVVMVESPVDDGPGFVILSPSTFGGGTIF